MPKFNQTVCVRQHMSPEVLVSCMSKTNKTQTVLNDTQKVQLKDTRKS